MNTELMDLCPNLDRSFLTESPIFWSGQLYQYFVLAVHVGVCVCISSSMNRNGTLETCAGLSSLSSPQI